jgi:uncharacterized membrane protein
MTPRLPFRRAFLTGLVVLIPIAVTGWMMLFIFRTVDGWIQPWFARTPWLRDHVPGEAATLLGVLVVVLLVTVVGSLANSLLGRAFLNTFDRVVARIPFLKGVYMATKELTGVLFADRSRAFRKVVVFEYPRRGCWSLGFVTNEYDVVSGEGLYHIFLPTTPNPTSGYFLMIPCKDAIQLEVSIEEGLKMVISGGAVVSTMGRDQILRHVCGDDRLVRVDGPSEPPTTT